MRWSSEKEVELLAEVFNRLTAEEWLRYWVNFRDDWESGAVAQLFLNTMQYAVTASREDVLEFLEALEMPRDIYRPIGLPSQVRTDLWVVNARDMESPEWGAIYWVRMENDKPVAYEWLQYREVPVVS